MKKLIALLMAVVIVLTLCACSGGNKETPKAEEEAQTAVTEETAAPAAEPDDEDAGETEKEPIDDAEEEETAAEEVSENADRIDLDEWTKTFTDLLEESGLHDVVNQYKIGTSSYSSDMISFALIDKEQVSYVSDRLVSLDGTEFTLPISAEDFNAAGWYTKDRNGQTLEYGYMASATLFNDEKGYETYGGIINVNEGTEVTFDKASVCSIEANPTTEFLNDPEIEICGGITVDSSLEDILSRLGYPELVSFSILYAFDNPSEISEIVMKIEYYEPGNANSNVVFELDYSTGKIKTFDIQYIPDL